jgi:Arc/MetJ-type ribon-helix-helix transcriptional regulator
MPQVDRTTICHMGTLTIRTDAAVERALESLTREGRSRSEAVRSAILEAERAHRRARMRAEAEEVRNDPDEVVASQELMEEMDSIRAW